MWGAAPVSAVVLASLGACLTGATAFAQTASDPVPLVRGAPILVFDQQRLFEGSQFGRAIIAQRKIREDALIAENLRIEQALEVEEKDLTTRRASLPAAEFRAIADAFDAKVEGLRAAQRAKYEEITAIFDADRQSLVDAAVPVFRDLMDETGAVVVMDKSAVLITLDRIDITDSAIARLDATLGDGNGPGVAPAPTPDTTPAQP